MSHEDVELVNSRRIRPAPKKMVLVALADYRNRDGRCFPSIPNIADMAGLAERQTIRLLKSLVADGLIASKPGGGRSSTRYALNFPAIRALPIVRGRDRVRDDTLEMSRTTLRGVLEDTSGVSSVTHEPGIEPGKNQEEAPRKRAISRAFASRGKTKTLTLKDWRDSLPADELPLPAGDPIYSYSEAIVPTMVAVAWHAFKAKFFICRPDERRADWRGYFREHVQLDYLRLWTFEASGAAKWTTAGLQALHALNASARDSAAQEGAREVEEVDRAAGRAAADSALAVNAAASAPATHFVDASIDPTQEAERTAAAEAMRQSRIDSFKAMQEDAGKRRAEAVTRQTAAEAKQKADHAADDAQREVAMAELAAHQAKPRVAAALDFLRRHATGARADPQSNCVP